MVVLVWEFNDLLFHIVPHDRLAYAVYSSLCMPDLYGQRLHTDSHTFKLRVASRRVRNNFPLKPDSTVQLISPLPWNQPIIRFLFHSSLMRSPVLFIHSGVSLVAQCRTKKRPVDSI